MRTALLLARDLKCVVEKKHVISVHEILVDHETQPAKRSDMLLKLPESGELVNKFGVSALLEPRHLDARNLLQDRVGGGLEVF
jgi:hypothetical protein